MPPAAPIRPRHFVPTQQGVGTLAPNDLTAFRDALQVFSDGKLTQSFVLRTSSGRLLGHPQTPSKLRLGLKSEYGSKIRLVISPKVIVSFGIKMMRQVIINHFFRHLS